MKDLIRYLRHEDETRGVRQQLGAAQILQTDLLPILTQHHQDRPLFDAVIRWMPQPLLSELMDSVFVPGEETACPAFSVFQADGELDTASLAVLWQCAQGPLPPAPFPAGTGLLAGLQRGEVACRVTGAERGQRGREGQDATYHPFPISQAFASEKPFGVLSETLYELLQLVSESLPHRTPWDMSALASSGRALGWAALGPTACGGVAQALHIHSLSVES